MRLASAVLTALAVGLLALPAAAQQTPAPTPTPPAALPVTQLPQETRAEPCSELTAAAPDDPVVTSVPQDVELFATIRARSLRFEQVGQGSITLSPESPTSICVVETNLPTPIEPNRVYTDVLIRLMIRTSLQEIANQRSAQP